MAEDTEAFDGLGKGLNGIWLRLIKASSPLMLRGTAGAAATTEVLRCLPTFPANDPGHYLQFSVEGAIALCICTLLFGMLTGK